MEDAPSLGPLHRRIGEPVYRESGKGEPRLIRSCGYPRASADRCSVRPSCVDAEALFLGFPRLFHLRSPAFGCGLFGELSALIVPSANGSDQRPVNDLQLHELASEQSQRPQCACLRGGSPRASAINRDNPGAVDLSW